MEYHQDRFQDNSLLFCSSNRVIGIMPANRLGNTIYSHQGLTYGGIVSDRHMTTAVMLSLFEKLLLFLREQGVTRLIYKPIPHIYSRQPAEEDLYALYIQGAQLKKREVSSVLALGEGRHYTKGKKTNLAKAQRANIEVRETTDVAGFIELLQNVLQMRHGINPVHSLEEITLLIRRFPNNIKLHCAFLGDYLLAGTLLFINERVVHTQYLANSNLGREMGALDLVVHRLIDLYSDGNKRYLSFGISTENDGQKLNYGLVASKEGFGARAIMHDLYEIEL